MRTRAIKLLASIFVLTIILSCLVSCSKSATSKLKIGYIPIADCAQMFVAIEKGYFKDENIDVEPVKLAGGSKILEALAGGSLQVGFSNIVSFILAKNSGLDFVAITGGPVEDTAHIEAAILVRKNSGINEVANLKGKKIAVNTRKNIVELMLTETLLKHGINPVEIKFVEIPFPQMENVLMLNQVDAVAAYEPFVTFAIKNGKSKILSYYNMEITPRIEISTYIVSNSWLNQNPEIAQKVQRAISKATDYALSNPEELRTIIAKYTSLTNEQMKGVSLPTFAKKLSPLDLQKISDLVSKRGWISKSVNATELIYSFENK